MELSNYNRYNNHKDMSLTIVRERAKLNIQSDQGYSDQVINTIPLSNGEDAVVHTKCATNAGRGFSPIGKAWEVKPYTSKLVVLTTSQKERCKNA